MAFPAVAVDADPDPTTQMAWPSARPKRVRRTHVQDLAHPESEERDDRMAGDPHSLRANGKAMAEPGKRRLSTWNLITLSISMAGAQVAWTVELG